MTLSTALRVIRVSAAYDIVVPTAFALPWTAAAAFHALGLLHHALGLSGTLPSPDTAFTMLFANLMGSLVTIWSVLRLVRPSLQLGAADTGARIMFSLNMALALAAGASTVLVPLLVLEIAWALVQGGTVLSAWRSESRLER